MNMKRFVVGSLVVWVFMFLFELILHGFVLNAIFFTSNTFANAYWGITTYVEWVALGELVLAFCFCAIFTHGYKNTGIAEGLRFGLLVGIGFGSWTAAFAYAVNPLSVMLVLSQGLVYVVEMSLAGIIIAAIYKPKN